MNKRAIAVGDIWKRRVEAHDDFDRIVVTGLVNHAGFRPDEWSIQSATSDFGPTVQTTAQGISDFCDRVSSGDPEADEWAS
jgi:hypothetical protein